ADQPNPDACASAPRDSSASRPGDETSSPRTRAHTSGSCPSTSTPEKPSLTAVRSPPTAAAITGVPQAWASSATSPNDSEWAGTSPTVAARYQPASSGGGHGGSNRPRPDRPSEEASPSSRPGAPTSVPLGPPTNTTASRSASAGASRSSEAAACS